MQRALSLVAFAIVARAGAAGCGRHSDCGPAEYCASRQPQGSWCVHCINCVHPDGGPDEESVDGVCPLKCRCRRHTDCDTKQYCARTGWPSVQVCAACERCAMFPDGFDRPFDGRPCPASCACNKHEDCGQGQYCSNSGNPRTGFVCLPCHRCVAEHGVNTTCPRSCDAHNECRAHTDCANVRLPSHRTGSALLLEPLGDETGNRWCSKDHQCHVCSRECLGYNATDLRFIGSLPMDDRCPCCGWAAFEPLTGTFDALPCQGTPPLVFYWAKEEGPAILTAAAAVVHGTRCATHDAVNDRGQRWTHAVCPGLAPYCEDETRQYAVVYDYAPAGDSAVGLFASGTLTIHGRSDSCVMSLVIERVLALTIAVFAAAFGGAFVCGSLRHRLRSMRPMILALLTRDDDQQVARAA